MEIIKDTNRPVRRAALSAIATLALLVGFAPNATATATAKRTPTVNATLIEYKVKLKPATVSAPAGKVKLVAKNKGTMTHEVIVVRAADAAALPVDGEGSVIEDEVDEEKPKIESESHSGGDHKDHFSVKAGKTKSAVFDLTPGTYVVFCNVNQDVGNTKISHFKQGQNAVLTVK
ncbi:MAG: hypothetical protein CK520_02485 [Actinobacteria bacterium]|nr:hypothetical protein [Acidimicrobiia bacterium]PHX59822.1 MAG: hypothetical protein CK520_02485 [Actinomycetota bacterium]